MGHSGVENIKGGTEMNWNRILFITFLCTSLGLGTYSLILLFSVESGPNWEQAESYVESKYQVNQDWEDLIVGSTMDFQEAIKSPGYEIFVMPSIQDVYETESGGTIIKINHFVYDIYLHSDKKVSVDFGDTSQIIISNITSIQKDHTMTGDLVEVYSF